MKDELVTMLDGVAFLLPNFNDTFYYASADTEQIPVGEGEVMAAWWRRHGWHGLVALAAWKRARHPLQPIAEDSRYTAALADLRSDETVLCAGDDEGGTWLWWFDLDDAPGVPDG